MVATKAAGARGHLSSHYCLLLVPDPLTLPEVTVTHSHLYFLAIAPAGTRSRKTTPLVVLGIQLKCFLLGKLNRNLSERVWGMHFLGIQTPQYRGESKREGERAEHEQTLSRRINIHVSYHSSTRKQAIILVQKDGLCLSLPQNPTEMP